MPKVEHVGDLLQVLQKTSRPSQGEICVVEGTEPILDAADPKQKFVWGEEQVEAVKKLHKMMIQNVALMHFDVNRETRILVDGSPVFGCGAVRKMKSLMFGA